jgi:AcrR family transcriptional regulator
MFKIESVKLGKGEATRQHVLETALKLFRRRGFERTTMRDIAEAAGLSLGAAYHYFRSKNDLVVAYYERMQAEHEKIVQVACRPDANLRTKLSTLFRTKLDLLGGDRKLLAALFGNLGDVSHPLSVFSRKTAAIRERSISQFVAVLDGPSVPNDLRGPLGRALWIAHLGVVLFFIHDGSPKQARTYKLVDTLVDLVASGIPLLTHPLAVPIRSRLLNLLAELDPTRGNGSKSSWLRETT